MSATDFTAPTQNTRLQRVMWIGLIFLCLIAAAIAVRRLTALAHPPRNVPPQLAGLDEAFAKKTSSDAGAHRSRLSIRSTGSFPVLPLLSQPPFARASLDGTYHHGPRLGGGSLGGSDEPSPHRGRTRSLSDAVL